MKKIIKYSAIVLFFLICLTYVSATDIQEDTTISTDETINEINDIKSEETNQITKNTQKVGKEAVETININSNNVNEYFNTTDGKTSTTNKVKETNILNLEGNFNNINFTIDKNNITFTSTKNNAKLYNCTVKLSGVNNVEVSNLYINNTRVECEGIILDNVNNSHITRNHVYANNSNDFIITTYDTTYTTIDNNLFESEHNQTNMRIYSSHHNLIKNNTVKGYANCIYLCSFDDISEVGDVEKESNYNIITDNTVIGLQDAAVCYTIKLMGNTNLVENNTVRGGYRGISSENSNIIRNNDVDATHIGIFTEENSTIENNYIHVSGDSNGITVSGNGSLIQNNIIVCNETGIVIDNNDILIKNNTITSKYYGIVSNSVADVYENITILENNIIGEIYNNGIMELRNNIIKKSSATEGGAIYNSGNMTLTNNTIISNKATRYGGAIYSTGVLTLSNNIITQNTAKTGAAVYNKKGTVIAYNNIFSNNEPASFQINNDTIVLTDAGLFMPKNAEVEIYQDNQLLQSTNMINSVINYTLSQDQSYKIVLTNNTASFNNNTFILNNNSTTNLKDEVVLSCNPIQDTIIGENITITGQIKDRTTKPLTNMTINIKINNKQYTTTTDQNGRYTLTTTADTYGTINVTITSPQTEQYEEKTIQKTVYAKNRPTLYLYSIDGTTSPVVISGKLLGNGKAITGSKLTLNINNNQYTLTPGSSGYFSYKYEPSTGLNNITVTFNGNDQYAPSNTSTSFSTKKNPTLYLYSIDNTTSTVAITGKLLGDGKAISGAKLVLKVNSNSYTVTPGSSGYFSYKITPENGKNNILVTYEGNTIYNSINTSTTFNHASKKQATLYLYSIDNTTSTVAITGKLLGDGKAISGAKLVLKVNSNSYTVTPGSSGYFSYKITPENGKNNILVTYEGNTIYNSINTSTTFNHASKKQATLYLYSIDNTTSMVAITGKLLGDGKGISGAKLVLKVNSNSYTVTPGSSGYFSYKITPENGKNNILVTYEGNDIYAKTTTNTTFTSNINKKATLYFYNIENTTEANTIKITGKLLDNGKAINGAKITLNINGKTYTVTPGSTGYFSYTYKATGGLNNITATFTQEGYTTTTATTTVYAKMKTTIYAYKISDTSMGSTIKISGKLLTSNKKAIPGKTITINIDSKQYTVTTNKDGYYQYDYKVTTNGIKDIDVIFAGDNEYIQNSCKTNVTVI